MITVEKLIKLGFKEYGSNLGATHYKKDDVEIRHTEENARWWLTDGLECFTIISELSTFNSIINLTKSNHKLKKEFTKDTRLDADLFSTRYIQWLEQKLLLN